MGIIFKDLSFKKISLRVRLGQQERKPGKFNRKLYGSDNGGHQSGVALACADAYCAGGVLELPVFLTYH